MKRIKNFKTFESEWIKNDTYEKYDVNDYILYKDEDGNTYPGKIKHLNNQPSLGPEDNGFKIKIETVDDEYVIIKSKMVLRKLTSEEIEDFIEKQHYNRHN